MENFFTKKLKNSELKRIKTLFNKAKQNILPDDLIMAQVKKISQELNFHLGYNLSGFILISKIILKSN